VRDDQPGGTRPHDRGTSHRGHPFPPVTGSQAGGVAGPPTVNGWCACLAALVKINCANMLRLRRQIATRPARMAGLDAMRKARLALVPA
jgi:hypothetical protein